MSVSRLGSRNRQSDYTWPGFVDALASLLMVFVFVLMVFVLIQANLAYRLSGKDASLSALQAELSTISNLLGKERDQSAKLSTALALSNSALQKAQDDILALSSNGYGRAEMDQIEGAWAWGVRLCILGARRGWKAGSDEGNRLEWGTNKGRHSSSTP